MATVLASSGDRKSSERKFYSSTIHVIVPAAVPNPNWLRSGNPSNAQKEFGDDLLRKHLFVLIPSVVSAHSSTLIFDPAKKAAPVRH